ncbi:MAG: bifunctional riboflavin kinase/FAD synthetase [Campylobacterales bacterium]|nr:bifunctional riboflavin kinase/FAD synthetase [Campylobacterales bacterium]
MSLFTSIVSSTENITSIAIGGFDGLHIGHKTLFSKLDENGAILVVENNHMDLTPKRSREKFCNYPFIYLQLDEVVGMTGEEFLDLLLKNFPKLKKIIVGYDFCFGKNRGSNATNLKEWFDGEVDIVTEVKVNDVSVHSRQIRNFIRLGEIKKANLLLGREYEIVGDVITGQGLGMRKLYPTINMSVKEYLLPNEGVYATRTVVKGIEYPSVSFIGHRVSTDGSFAVETHILKETQNFQAEQVDLSFVEKMRENRYFDDLEELKAQIKEDIEQAITLLK